MIFYPARLKRRILTLDDINKYKDATPPLKNGSSKMFRNLRDKGIISYTEYLFLLSILTSENRINSTKLPMIFQTNRFIHTLNICERFFLSEPKSGFKIAFNMFDTDDSKFVDKDEFLVVSIKIIVLKDVQKPKKSSFLSKKC